MTQLAGSSDDPAVIEASLRAVLTLYSSRSSQQATPDAELDRVLIQRLRDERPAIAAAALTAARVPLMTEQPSDQLTVAIAEAAGPQLAAPRRQLALEALNWIRGDRRSADVVTAIEQALAAAEPAVLSLALLALAQSGPSIEGSSSADRTRLSERVLQLGTHPNPAVRGRALGVFTEIAWLLPAAARFETAQLSLRDPDPYVRAQAADLLLRCKEARGIHVLIEHVADLAVARYELSGWTNLDGSPGRLVHTVPGRKRVADAALLAILTLSEGLPGVAALPLTLGGRAESDEVILQNAAIARSWYGAQGANIPRQPTLSAP